MMSEMNIYVHKKSGTVLKMESVITAEGWELQSGSGPKPEKPRRRAREKEPERT